MQQASYEDISFLDTEFPLIFHFDELNKNESILMHWQDSLEILYFVNGKASVSSDAEREPMRAGDVALIGCGRLHAISSETEKCRYYCLIADRSFCENLGLAVKDRAFRLKISDAASREMFEKIIAEMDGKREYYKQAVLAEASSLLIHFCREFSEGEPGDDTHGDRRPEMVKTAIRYIRDNFKKPLTVEEISAATGFSKFYFCRSFKQITDRTAIEYLNLTRCRNAAKLLSSGRYNVSESALMSGFSNLSYFTRTYKKHIGELPSQTERPPE